MAFFRRKSKKDLLVDIQTSISNSTFYILVKGELDWVNAPVAIHKQINKAFEGEFTGLEIDFSGLSSARHENGVLGTYFLALLIFLVRETKKREMNLKIILESRAQVEIINVVGNKMWNILGDFLYFKSEN